MIDTGGQGHFTVFGQSTICKTIHVLIKAWNYILLEKMVLLCNATQLQNYTKRTLILWEYLIMNAIFYSNNYNGHFHLLVPTGDVHVEETLIPHGIESTHCNPCEDNFFIQGMEDSYNSDRQNNVAIA